MANQAYDPGDRIEGAMPETAEYCEYCDNSGVNAHQFGVDVTYCEHGAFLCDKHLEEIADERETLKAVIVYDDGAVAKLTELLKAARDSIPFASVEENWIREDLEFAYNKIVEALRLV